MWHLYLDESGDLGFDFVNKKPSKFFVITILAIQTGNEKKLRNAVKRTLKKINHKRKRVKINELKGTQLDLNYKKYFLDKLDFPHAIYTIVLNKRRVFEQLANDKSRVYNYISRLLIENLPFEKAKEGIKFFIDKCKSKHEVVEFNRYITSHLEARLGPEVSLDILHEASHRIPGLQAADLFAHGVFRKYEKQDLDWYQCFEKQIAFEELYSKNKEPI